MQQLGDGEAVTRGQARQEEIGGGQAGGIRAVIRLGGRADDGRCQGGGRDGQDAIGVTPSAIWLSGISLQRIDPSTGRVVRTVDQGGITLAAGFGSLWVTDVVGRILRLDPQRLRSG